MNTISERFWVNLVSIVIAGVCVLAVIVISLREKRRTGSLPREVTGDSGGVGWFGLIWWIWFSLSLTMLEPILHRFPLYILVPGVDLAMFLASAALAGFALTWVFRAEWNWRTCPLISYCLLLPALTSTVVIRDFKCLTSMAWAWILAGLLAAFLTPYLARLTYLEFYLNRVRQSK